MQMLKSALTFSSAQQEAFEREERQRERRALRSAFDSIPGKERLAAAEAKRRRRQERNLAHC